MLTSALLAAVLAAGADTTLLRILATNDFHGTLEPRVYAWSQGRPIGGASALKATLDSAAAQCRCPVLRLDGGDQMQGSLGSNLVFGRSTVEVLNAVGLDGAAVGNHDLDWGVDTLRARMREARYPWLAANVFDSLTGRRAGWTVPWRMVERGGLRVALVGYLTAESKGIIKAENTRGLVWRRGLDGIKDALAEARAARPDLTIIVAHAGAFCDSLPCRGEIVDLARELDSTQVQLIVSGHTHSLVNTVVNGIPIVQARSNGTAYGVADLIRKPDGSRQWRVRVETVWADRVAPDPQIASILGKYRPMVEKLSTQVVATLRDSFPLGRGETALGNLIADAQRAAAPGGGIDFGLMNNGGVRRALFPGKVSYGELFELQPFANAVVTVRLTGAQLKAVLEHAVDGGRPNATLSGLAVRWDPGRPRGDRVVEIRRSSGELVSPDRSYVLALSDFLQTGGDGYNMLRILEPTRTGKSDLEALVDYLKRQPQPVASPQGPRWLSEAP